MGTIDKVNTVFCFGDEYMKKITIILLLLVGTLINISLAQDNPIATRIEVYAVSVVTGEDGKKEERFSELDKVYRNQVIEYRLIASNQGEITLPEEIVVLTLPIPENTVYVNGSATPSSEQVLTEFTLDNETFREQPLMDTITAEDGTQEEVIIDYDRYKGVRWTLLVPFEPSQEAVFSYRVKILR